ncbi:MAG: DUF2934 domain-containing protein [Nitrospiraceae bacterium]
MKAQPSKQVVKNTPAIPQGGLTKQQSSAGMSAPTKQPMFDDLPVRITARAYELYVERGCREGCAEQDWLDAEGASLNKTFPV